MAKSVSEDVIGKQLFRWLLTPRDGKIKDRMAGRAIRSSDIPGRLTAFQLAGAWSRVRA
jgi:hypothetical protein